MVGAVADPVLGPDSRHRLGHRARSVFQILAESRPVAWAVFTVLYAIPTVYLARLKLFWDDEFFTLYLSRTPTWQDLLQALATGADQHPPSFYYLTHLTTTVFGSGHVTVRLPAILGFWLLCICLYEIVRDLAAPEWAVVAMFFPLSTEFYYYASEARGYGLVCGFSALAMLSWMRSAAHRNRTAYIPLLAVSIAAGVASHYYAVLVVVALALGAIVRPRYTEKINCTLSIAYVCGSAPLQELLLTIQTRTGHVCHFTALPVL